MMSMYGKLAAFLATRIGDCLGAIAAGLFCIVVSQRSPAEEAFFLLGVPLLVAGLVTTAIAFTRGSRLNG
jgi:hypothetical protein